MMMTMHGRFPASKSPDLQKAPGGEPFIAICTIYCHIPASLSLSLSLSTIVNSGIHKSTLLLSSLAAILKNNDGVFL